MRTFFVLLLKWSNQVGAIHVIEEFLSLGIYDNLITCHCINNDFEYNDMVEISEKFNITVQSWDCKNLIKINRALMILCESRPNMLSDLLEQPGAQKSLISNSWIIRTKNDYAALFRNNKLKIGLNANIFVVEQFIDPKMMFQAGGTGTTIPKFQVLTNLNHIHNCNQNLKLHIQIS